MAKKKTTKKKKVGLSDKVRLSKSRKNVSNSLNEIKHNPFEVKVNRQKHNILGRKSKHDRGLPGVSRSKSSKKRKETLLHEYKRLFKSNRIKDGRFGASNKHLSLEEKMLQRFTIEKKRKHEKMAQFSLNDEEELTHLGKSLSTIGNSKDSAESDEEIMEIDSEGEPVDGDHIGGGMFKRAEPNENEEKPKSKAEIIDEIILKSKTLKHEKQKEKDSFEVMCNQLDAKYQDVREILKTRGIKKMEQPKHLDDYDTLMREMAFDRVALPGTRKKTIEETNREKESLLKKQEDERLQRMRFCTKAKTSKHESADALGDEYLVESKREDVPTLSFPFSEETQIGDEQNDQNDDVSLEGAEKESEIADQGIVDDGASLDDDELDEESDDFSDIDSGNEDDEDVLSLEEEQDVMIPLEENTTKDKSNKAATNFPASYAEYAALMSSGLSAAEVTTKLRSEYAPDLAEGNKLKLIELFAYVWEHSCRMASMSPPNMAVIGSLCSHLYELCCLNLDSCTQCVIERLKRSYHYCFLSANPLRPKWPKFEMLMQFKMIKLFYSTSDFSHTVATRALVFMCNVLNNCRVTTLREVAVGLFLSTLVYEYVCFSKRFVSESLSFLLSCLCMSMPVETQRQLKLPAIVCVHLDKLNCNLLVLDEEKPVDFYDEEKLNIVQLLDDEAELEDTAQLRHRLLNATLSLLTKFTQLYVDLPAFDDVFSPLKQICESMLDHRIGTFPAVSRHLNSILSIIKENLNRPKKRLSIGLSKPKPLKLFSPKMEEPGEPFDKRSRNVSATKRQKDRLLHNRRREMKGAIREIRKDSKFLWRQKQQETEQKDSERAEKVKRLYGLLSNQEGDYKKIKRSKYKLNV